MRTCAFLLLATLSSSAIVFTGTAALAAPVPKHLMKEPDNTEQGKLQGTWKLTSLRVGGTELGADIMRGMQMTLEIRGDSLNVNSAPGGNTAPQRITATIKLDVANGVKRFSTTDTRKADADGKPTRKEEDVSCGYAIDGDKLTWAMAPGANGKADLADPAKPGPNAILMVFTRVKDEK